jgi:BirA family biotin operon repressor/biotin-[acetyl-CoA-carboxylase] ligase
VSRHHAGPEDEEVNPHGPASIEIERVAETRSTNADLMAWARGLDASGRPPRPCLRVAERQTAGRGRLGRAWHAAPGASLTFSLAWPFPGSDLSGLSLAVGVALADALDDADPPGALRIGLKWPNDLWLVGPGEPGRKLGGVLIETTPSGTGRLAVIGIGLNVLPLAVPDASSGVASLHEIDRLATTQTVLDRLVPALSSALSAFARSGLAPFLARFAARDLLAGRAVRCAGAADVAIDGVAEGITADGELRLRTADGRLERIGSGEVSVRPVPLEAPQPSAEGAPC